jgi:hypothetical protein
MERFTQAIDRFLETELEFVDLDLKLTDLDWEILEGLESVLVVSTDNFLTQH